MFSLFKSKDEMQLDAIISQIEANMANNYKDNAQEALKAFEIELGKVSLNDKKKAKYLSMLEDYKNRMKEFTHKDQKPYWT